MKLILITIFALGLPAQTTINPPAIQLDAAGTNAVRTWMLGQTKGTDTTLAANALIGATSITVASSVGIAVGNVIIIGTEMLDVTAKSGAVLTVTRAHNGTVAAAYTNGAAVKEAKYRGFNQLAKMCVVDALKHIVEQSVVITGAVTTAQATAAAATEAAVQ